MTVHRICRRTIENPTRIKAYDRRAAAIHEAGHALMAVHLGYVADAWVYPNDSGNPLESKTWVGHVCLHGGPNNRSHSRLIALAGMAAETIWKNGHHEDYAHSYGWEDYLLDGDAMSFSDWRLADCSPGYPDDDLHEVTAEVGALFMSDLWPTLTDMSRILMSGSESIFTFGEVAARAA